MRFSIIPPEIWMKRVKNKSVKCKEFHILFLRIEIYRLRIIAMNIFPNYIQGCSGSVIVGSHLS